MDDFDALYQDELDALQDLEGTFFLEIYSDKSYNIAHINILRMPLSGQIRQK